MPLERNQIQIPQILLDSGKYIEKVLAFFRDMRDPDAKWRAERFKQFWSEPSFPVGVIETFQPDPTESAQFIASVVLEEKLGRPPSHWFSKSTYYDISELPLIMFTWNSDFAGKSPDAKLAWMIGEAANCIHCILPDPVMYQSFDENIHNPGDYSYTRLEMLEDRLAQVQPSFKWPFENDERKMVCLVVGIEKVTNGETYGIVKRLIMLLEAVFVREGKGKLVFVGSRDSDAIKWMEASCGREKVVVVYEAYGVTSRPEDSEAWNMNG